MFKELVFIKSELTLSDVQVYNCKSCHELSNDSDYRPVTSKCGLNGSSKIIYVLKRCLECKKFLKNKGIETVEQYYELLLRDLL